MAVVGSSFRFIQALHRQAVDRTPVWIMRQAGRYMPEYRALRQQADDFVSFCKSPDLCTQAAMLPIERYDLDAAIVFSDILVVPDAMGIQLSFVQHEGPIISDPIRNLHDIDRLKEIDARTDLDYVLQAIHSTKKQLNGNRPLIGFIGSPWTLAAYMVEGSSSKQFSQLRRMLYDSPNVLHQLLQILTNNLINFVEQQIIAGADAIQIFDSWAGLLNKECYSEFSLKYIRKIINAIKMKYPQVPIIVFAKNNGNWIEEIVNTYCDAISLDWQTDIADVKNNFGQQVAIQGNLDPCVLYASKKVIEKETLKILDLFKNHKGFVFNLGHGIYPDVPPENVSHMLDVIRNY